MTGPTKLAAFAVALAIAFVVGFGIGEVVGPLDSDEPAKIETHDNEEHR